MNDTTFDPRVHMVRDGLADRRLEGRVSAERFVDGRPARVRLALADLRRRPAADAPLETQGLYGESVLVFDRGEEGWSLVQLAADGYVGWLETEALGEPEAAALRVRAPRTLVFPGPDIKLPPIGALPMGARVQPVGEAEDRNARYALLAPSGAVVRQHLEPIDAAAPDFVATAEAFLGAPYLWGGRSSLGIDCSGLTQIALLMAGIAAPRDSDQQEAWVERIDPEAPRRRGDLVFWKGHVGVMLDEARLLHANAHHMMTAIERLSEAVERIGSRGSPVTTFGRAPHP